MNEARYHCANRPRLITIPDLQGASHIGGCGRPAEWSVCLPGVGVVMVACAPRARQGSRKHADVAQLVEHHLAKVRVAGSNPVVRSERVSYLAATRPVPTGGVAERRGNGLQIRVHGFESRLHLGRLAQLVARFPDTEEVISSSLVPPTSSTPGQGTVPGQGSTSWLPAI